jgi:arylsulfate sulfotransferase
MSSVGPITITPSADAVSAGATVQFTATAGQTVQSSVIWSVNNIPGGNSTSGTITSSGLYTAPTLPSAAVFAIGASVGSGATSSTAFASVSVLPPGTVSATHNPLVALYTLSTPPGATVQVEFGLDTNYGLETWSQPAPAGGGSVNIFVAGMKASTTYHMRAIAELADGITFTDADQTFTTGAVPPGQVPSVTATTTPGMTPSGGIEMLDLVHLAAGPQQNVLATDLDGNVIWYLDIGNTSLIPDPVKLLPDGDVLVNLDDSGPDGTNSVLEEVDLAGDIIWQLTAADLNAELAAAGYNLTVVGTHHDVAVLPNGHLILIASTMKDFTDLPGYPGTTAVTGDVLIDLDQSRKPVWVWSEFDHLDVNRHPMGFPPDWTHTNAVLYSPDDGNLIISMRHQHWLAKVDYADGTGSGDVIWKMGWEGDLTLNGGTDPVDWFYAQHGPSLVGPSSSGVFQIIIFDNGDNRLTNGQACGQAPTSPCYSRVPIFQVDEAAKTATITWQDTLGLFSYFGGNAEVLPNNDVEFDECASAGSSAGAAVYEVTQDPLNPQTVWQMHIDGQDAYRAFRVPSLYPGVQW